MKKWTLRFFKIGMVVAILGIGIALHFLLPKLIVDTKATRNYNTNNNQLNTNSKAIQFKSFDNIIIRANWRKTESKAKGTIILLHGIRGYKEYFTNISAQLNDSGYNTLALDLRAHGTSGGNYCTYGYNEKKDIAAAIDYLLDQPEANNSIGVWGQSLGGAIAMQALAFDKRLKFGIIESTFSDLETIVDDYSERMFGFSIPWANDYALKRAGDIADFNPKEVSPVLSASRITQPMLVAHGTDDKHIKFDYGKANFDNLASKKRLSFR